MTKLLTKIYMTLAIILITTSIGAFPVTHADQPTAQDQAARAFIENVLPVDLSKYHMTLTKQMSI